MKNPNAAERVNAAVKGKDTLSDSDVSQLRNSLVVAAERFDENAAMFRAIADQGKTDPEGAQKACGPMVHWSACGPLADDFERQAAATRGLIDWIDGPDDEEHDGKVVETLTLTRQIAFQS